MTLPTLRTARLTLCQLAVGDAQALHEAYGDAEAMRWWDSPALPDAAATAEMVARQCAEMAAGGHAYWAVVPDGAGVAGSVDLSDIDHDAAFAEVGYILAPRYWGRGLGREALAAVIEYGASIGLRRFGARFHVGNVASERLLAALGFAPAQRLAAAVVRDGAPRDCLIWTRGD